MNKKVAIGVGVAAMLLVVCAAAVMVTDWDDYMSNDSPESIPFTDVVDEEGNLDESSLNYNLFEKYGPLLIVVGILMFGAIVGGVCIAREDVEE